MTNDERFTMDSEKKGAVAAVVVKKTCHCYFFKLLLFYKMPLKIVTFPVWQLTYCTHLYSNMREKKAKCESTNNKRDSHNTSTHQPISRHEYYLPLSLPFHCRCRYFYTFLFLHWWNMRSSNGQMPKAKAKAKTEGETILGTAIEAKMHKMKCFMVTKHIRMMMTIMLKRWIRIQTKNTKLKSHHIICIKHSL